MSDLTCQIVTRKIYAYVAEVYGPPTFWDGKWCLMVTVFETMAADAVSYADALLEELEKKK